MTSAATGTAFIAEVDGDPPCPVEVTATRELGGFEL